MNGIIKKTAIMTSLILVATLFLGAFGLFVFAPKYTGDLCFEIGMKNSAVNCYEIAYGRTGDYGDLVDLVNCSAYTENYEVMSRYGKIMLEREVEFNDFCKQGDQDVTEGDYTTYGYYTTAIMLAFYKTGDKQSSASIAVEYTLNGYVETSALYAAVRLCKNDSEFLGVLVSAYKGGSNKLSGTHLSKFREDIKAIDPEIKI